MTIGFVFMIMMLQVRGKGERKYYSLHSWIGIGIAIAYGLQWFRVVFNQGESIKGKNNSVKLIPFNSRRA